MICTWKDCNKKGKFSQLDKNGNEWANLCEEHNRELDESIGLDFKKMLSSWIKASGGAKKMTEKNQSAVKAGANLMKFLSSNKSLNTD